MNKLALFDIDKTLIINSSAHRKSFSIAFKEIYGLDTGVDAIDPTGMTDQQIIYEVLKLSGLSNEKIKEKINLCMERMTTAFSEMVANDELVVLPGVRELLKKLEENNILTGLVTGNLEPIARSKMKKLNLDNYFKLGGFGNEHISRTELVKIAIAKAKANFDFIFNDNVFLFGDAPQDASAGKEAGVISIGVATGAYSKEQLKNAGATLALDDLTDTDFILKYILK